MPTRRAVLAAMATSLAGCGSDRRQQDRGPTATPPMEYASVEPATPTPRPSPLSIDRGFQWPGPFYDAANTGHVPTSGPTEAPSVQWEAWLPRTDRADHALIDGRWLYVFGEGHVTALDRRDGRLQRTTALPVTPVGPPSLVDGDFVFGFGERRFPTGIARVGAEGDLTWKREFESGASTAPIVADGTVYVAAEELLALALEDGAVAWRHRPNDREAFTTLPAVSADTVYVHGSQESMYAVDAASGQREWRYSSGTYQAPTLAPTVGDTLLFGGFDYGAANAAFDREMGALAWTTDSVSPVGSHTLAGDRLVAATAEGTVIALSRRLGTTEWEVQGGAGRPVVADETVFVRGPRGDERTEHLLALSLRDGSTHWHRRLDDEGWVLVADGYVYVNRGGGVVQCLG